MLTDRPPRAKALRAEFEAIDALAAVDLPPDDRLRAAARAIETALAAEDQPAAQRACRLFCQGAAEFFAVPEPPVRVLAARPLKVYRDGGSSELFGDYDLETDLIRVWMRTAVKRRVTSFGTLLSTLCHEFCHHLDRHRFGFSDTPHTRGFYARTAVLYHHARGTPLRPLHWIERGRGCWQIDWTRMRRG